ncbi:response regulator [Paludisphaera soli]|uniref:response regulator n=1 Tax=Paludisphaera soli TaxID=2712865 RepID=UPI0013ECAF8F|nr:response regulator [Paludisphaera soli]
MSRSILVVEDNADNRKLFEWVLEDEGYSAQCVATAEEGLAALEARPFDLVLMDVSLPGMDGKEATRRIRADPRLAGLPILAVTAHAVTGEAEAILASGVTSLLTKPVDESVLLAVIRSALGGG